MFFMFKKKKKKKTTADIMSSLTKKIQELEDHAKDMQLEAERIDNKISKLTDERADAVTENLTAKGFIRGLKGLFVTPESEAKEEEETKEEN